MEHVAIMRKSWGLTEKILSGKKTIESRWYDARYPPWNRIRAGERVYFKDSGEPVTIMAYAKKVMQYQDLTPKRVRDILQRYGQADGLGIDDIEKFLKRFKDKRYCILVFLKNPERIKPFNIDKSGFGIMSAWICIDDVDKIKK
jgi:ASC-1-like (ASCH) protein